MSKIKILSMSLGQKMFTFQMSFFGKVKSLCFSFQTILVLLIHGSIPPQFHLGSIIAVKVVQPMGAGVGCYRDGTGKKLHPSLPCCPESS